jgi:hypothetical protein
LNTDLLGGKQAHTSILKEALSDLVHRRHKELYVGKLDDKLVYKKEISKRLEDHRRKTIDLIGSNGMADLF